MEGTGRGEFKHLLDLLEEWDEEASLPVDEDSKRAARLQYVQQLRQDFETTRTVYKALLQSNLGEVKAYFEKQMRAAQAAQNLLGIMFPFMIPETSERTAGEIAQYQRFIESLS